MPGLASKSDVRKVADAGPLYCPLIKFDLANGTFSDGFTLDKDCTGPAREVWKRFKKGFPSEIIIDVVNTDIKDWRERVSLFLDDHDIYSGSHTSNYYSAPFDYNGDVVGLLHIRVRHEDDETVQFSRFDLRDEESRKATVFDLNLALRGKVDKVTGKGLSANDFTNALKAKLEGLRNYDDTALNKEIDALEKRIDTLVGGSASEAIDTFNEIEAFLAGISDTSSLTKMLSDLRASVLEEIASQDMTEAEASEMCDTIFGEHSGGAASPNNIESKDDEQSN